eukprot:gene5100-2230_t
MFPTGSGSIQAHPPVINPDWATHADWRIRRQAAKALAPAGVRCRGICGGTVSR